MIYQRKANDWDTCFKGHTFLVPLIKYEVAIADGCRKRVCGSPLGSSASFAIVAKTSLQTWSDLIQCSSNLSYLHSFKVSLAKRSSITTLVQHPNLYQTQSGAMNTA
jgi:hypothetical protein